LLNTYVEEKNFEERRISTTRIDKGPYLWGAHGHRTGGKKKRETLRGVREIAEG